MIFGADPAHEAGDEAAARDVVEHREFLGDHERVVHQRQRPAEHGDRAFRAPRERTGDHARRRHQTVGVLVMFVDAETVEAGLVGKLEFVEVAVVERVPLDRIVVAVGQRHPRRLVRVRVREIEIGIRHQMERDELHARAPRERVDRGRERLRLFDMRQVAGIGDHVRARTGDGRREPFGLCRRKDRIARAPHDQRRARATGAATSPVADRRSAAARRRARS